MTEEDVNSQRSELRMWTGDRGIEKYSSRNGAKGKEKKEIKSASFRMNQFSLKKGPADESSCPVVRTCIKRGRKETKKE